VRHSVFIVVLLLAGCASSGPGPFMGYPEDRDRLIEEERLRVDDSMRGLVTMTAVQPAAYEEYVATKARGKIVHEERRGDFLYWARESYYPVPMPPERAYSPANAYVRTVHRYRSALPGTD